jgi:GNAT superfamily N-acetyltransferase
VVARIAACVNRLHNEVHGDRVGFFGWFDVEPDPEAATALVAAARAWVAARGMTSLRGPVCYSTNDVCGVLVDGFEHPPMLMMPWNRPDYDALLRGAGLAKAKDLVAYWIPSSSPIPERYVRVTDRALARLGFTLRDIDLKRWRAEVDTVKALYNRSWERNWGFVPMTDAEFEHAAKDLRQIVDPRMFMMVERAGVPVGFAGILPDVNEALVGLDGRLFPFGLFKLLRRMKRIRNVRIVLLGVVPEARGRGVDAAIFVRALTKARECGYAGGEASWVLEDNERMRADSGLAKVWRPTASTRCRPDRAARPARAASRSLHGPRAASSRGPGPRGPCRAARGYGARTDGWLSRARTAGSCSFHQRARSSFTVRSSFFVSPTSGFVASPRIVAMASPAATRTSSSLSSRASMSAGTASQALSSPSAVAAPSRV